MTLFVVSPEFPVIIPVVLLW